jgi:porin
VYYWSQGASRGCWLRQISIFALTVVFVVAQLPIPRASQGETLLPNIYSGADPSLVSQLFERRCGIHSCISGAPVYYGELFTNARGGISTKDATRYQALLDLPITFDFDKTRVPVPGKFFLLAQNTHGRGLTENFVGDSLVLSDIDSFDNIAQVSEYWWQFGLYDNKVTVRLGKQDLNTEFVYIDLAVDFIQSSFELTPSVGLPTFPDPSMAGVVLMQLKDSMQLKVGVWDVLASGGSWGFSGNDTMVVIGELEYKYALGTGQFPGTVAVAAAYASDGAISGVPFGSSSGYAVQFEQVIYREGAIGEDIEQGLGIFAAFYPRFADFPIVPKSIGDNFVAGLVYTGLIPKRDWDVVGAGVARAELFQGGTNEETVVELFYKAQLTPRVSLQPDLQYIATPSGIHRDALAVGVRFQMVL